MTEGVKRLCQDMDMDRTVFEGCWILPRLFDFSPLLWTARQASFSQPPKVLKFINFLAQNNKNKKYENRLASTDLITKKHPRSKRASDCQKLPVHAS